MAVLSLPGELDWQCAFGAERPRLGWYSPRFGVRMPAVTLVGSGRVSGGETLVSTLRFMPLAVPHAELAS
jgi:hypothetical protein